MRSDLYSSDENPTQIPTQNPMQNPKQNPTQNSTQNPMENSVICSKLTNPSSSCPGSLLKFTPPLKGYPFAPVR